MNELYALTAIGAIAKEQGTNAKIALAAEYLSDYPDIRYLLEAALSPYKHYGVTKRVKGQRKSKTTATCLIGAIEVLEYSPKTKETFQQFDDDLYGLGLTEEDIDLVWKIVTKKLKIGIDVKGLNKAGYNLPTFECMLAATNKDNSCGTMPFPALLMPKLDGCFDGDSLVWTTDGQVKIKDIEVGDSVLSFNESTQSIEVKPVVNTFNNGLSKERDFLGIFTTSSKEKFDRIVCTKNHKIFTDCGWKEAKDLKQGDKIFSNARLRRSRSAFVGLILGDGSLTIEKRRKPDGNITCKSYRYRLCSSIKDKASLEHIVNILGFGGKYTYSKSGYGSELIKFTSKAITNEGMGVNIFYDLNPHSKTYGERKEIEYRDLVSDFNLLSLSIWIAGDGSLAFNNGNTFTPRLTLSTHRYSSSEVRMFVKLLENKFKCKPSIIDDKRKLRKDGSFQQFLTFSTKDTLYLLNMLRPYQIEGMGRKFYFDPLPFVKLGSDYEEIRNIEEYIKPRLKYDLEVADNHNYFVNNKLVHNCRMLLFPKRIALGRSGKPVPNRALVEWLPDTPWILDGEFYMHGVPFDEISGLFRAKDRPIPEGYKFHVFNAFTEQEWNSQKINATYDEVMQRVRSICGLYSTSLVPVGSKVVDDEEAVSRGLQELWDQGYEGGILRNVDKPAYMWKRCSLKDNCMIKLKKIDYTDAKITGFREGEGKYLGMLGALQVQLENGIDFEIGTGYTDDQRVELWQNRDELLGEWVHCKFTELTDTGMPRPPVVFMNIRDSKG